jgi:hypothetical protein
MSRLWNGLRAASSSRCACQPPSTSRPVSQRRAPIRRESSPGSRPATSRPSRRVMRHSASLEAREAEFRVLLPVPVRREVGERAKPRLAFSHRALGLRAPQELADLRADGAERLPQALVGLADAPRAELEHRAHRAGGADRKDRGGVQPGLLRKPPAQLRGAAVAGDVRDPERLVGLPHRADQAFARAQCEVLRRLGEAPRAVVAGHGPVGDAPQHPVPGLPEDGAIPSQRVADRLERTVQRLGRRLRLGKAQRDGVIQLEKLLDALLLGDVAADAAVAAEAATTVEGRLAADADVAAPAIGQVAPHEHVAERRVRLQQRAVRFPAAVDVDAGFPALLAEDALRHPLVGVVAGVDAREAQLAVLLPVPVGGKAEKSGSGCSGRGDGGRGRSPRCRHAPCWRAFRFFRHAPSIPRINLLDVYLAVQSKKMGDGIGIVREKR